MRLTSLFLLLGIAVATGGCASSKSGDTYRRDEARRMQNVQVGTVVDTRRIKVEGARTAIGTSAGTVVGAIAGSSAGQGRGSSVGAVLGAVAGGVVGAAAEEGLTREDGIEITVKLENGQLISVVHTGKEQFQSDDRVRIMEVGGETRVSHY